ncbi:cyclase family protein [Paenibacillus periandrae]|uniref:cyclase family protein n=1 Tax=Paenibacillus periandrae TaxID=1761741 RepID=UPI001F09A30D|nr:cyclase family protein [Paenibacillus periandrae]
MSRKVIDLSVTIDEEMKDPLPLKIEYERHEEGVHFVSKMAGVPVEAFGGYSFAGETLTLATHCGTHVDAPWHYYPTSEGKRARTIDELPLEWFFGHGVVLDFTDKPAGYGVTAADIQDKLSEIQYQIKPFDIVLIRSDADKKRYDDGFSDAHVGVTAEGTRWLLEQGIKLVGTDGWGWDIPMKLQAEAYRKDPRPGIMFEAHMVGKDIEYCQIEKMANLDRLPPYGFTVYAFPTKVKAGSGGWTRAVAIVES